MSGWEALSWAKKQRCREVVNGREKGKSGPKFCLIMLSDYADESFTCYPKMETLAEDMECSVSVVSEHLRWLEDKGLIRVLERWGKRGGRRSNRYQLLVLGPDTPLPDAEDWKHIRSERRLAELIQDGVDDEGSIDDNEAERGSSADPSGMTPESGGMPDQGEHTSRIPGYAGHTSRIRRYEPPESGGMNLQNPEVSNKKEVEPPGFDLPRSNPPSSLPSPTPAGLLVELTEEEVEIAENRAAMLLIDLYHRLRVDEARWPVGSKRTKLIQLVSNHLIGDWRPTELLTALSESVAGVTSVYAVIKHRLDELPTQRPSSGPAPEQRSNRRCPKGPAHSPYPAAKCPICEVEQEDAMAKPAESTVIATGAATSPTFLSAKDAAMAIAASVGTGRKVDLRRTPRAMDGRTPVAASKDPVVLGDTLDQVSTAVRS